MRLAFLATALLVGCTAVLDFKGISEGTLAADGGGGDGATSPGGLDGGVPFDSSSPVPDGSATPGDAGNALGDNVWLLDEGSGSVAQDSVGGVTATLSGNGGWINGVRGKAVALSGGKFVATALNGTAFPTEGTLTFWVAFAPGCLDIFDSDSSLGPGFYLGIGSQLSLRARSGPGQVQPIASVTTPPESTWVRIEVTWSEAAGTASLGVRQANGSLNAVNGTLPSGFSTSGQVFTFDDTFEGALDEIRLFRRKLSTAELDALP